jgi:zinc protease
MKRPAFGFGAFILLLGMPGPVAARVLSPRPTDVLPASATMRAQAPEDTMTSSFDVGTLKVILRRNPANEVVAANLYLLGGVQQVTPDNAGIEPLMLFVSERGTAHRSREALRRSIAAVGSTIVTEPTEDWTMFGFRGIRATLDSTWAIFADRLMEPTFDSADVELVRAQFLNAIRQRRDSPDALVEYLADSLTFAGSPYALVPSGTERSISSITVADLHRYHDSQLVTSRMLLVVVGNVERSQIERLVSSTLAKLPRGDYVWKPPVPPNSRTSQTIVEQRPLPTNYLRGYYIGPPATSPDYQALRIAAAVLSGRLFSEIRVRRNLSYAPEAPFVERAIASGGFYVTTGSPDQTLDILRTEMDNLKSGLVDPNALERLESQFITEYFLNNETNAEQANFLARAQLYRGDWHLASRFVDELRNVSPLDVRRVARTYMHDMRFAYVGDSSKFSKGKAKF